MRAIRGDASLCAAITLSLPCASVLPFASLPGAPPSHALLLCTHQGVSGRGEGALRNRRPHGKGWCHLKGTAAWRPSCWYVRVMYGRGRPDSTGSAAGTCADEAEARPVGPLPLRLGTPQRSPLVCRCWVGNACRLFGGGAWAAVGRTAVGRTTTVGWAAVWRTARSCHGTEVQQSVRGGRNFQKWPGPWRKAEETA